MASILLCESIWDSIIISSVNQPWNIVLHPVPIRNQDESEGNQAMALREAVSVYLPFLAIHMWLLLQDAKMIFLDRLSYFLSLTTVISSLLTHYNKEKAYFQLSFLTVVMILCSHPYFPGLTCDQLVEKRHKLWPKNWAKQLACMEIKPIVPLAHPQN